MNTLLWLVVWIQFLLHLLFIIASALFRCLSSSFSTARRMSCPAHTHSQRNANSVSPRNPIKPNPAVMLHCNIFIPLLFQQVVWVFGKGMPESVQKRSSLVSDMISLLFIDVSRAILFRCGIVSFFINALLCHLIQVVCLFWKGENCSGSLLAMI